MSRRREFQAGAVFHQIAPALHPMITSPYASESLGPEEIPLKQIRGTQKKLDPARVQHYVDNPDHDPITVARWGGPASPSYVYDGHHRAAAAKKRGKKTMTANVYRVFE